MFVQALPLQSTSIIYLLGSTGRGWDCIVPQNRLEAIRHCLENRCEPEVSQGIFCHEHEVVRYQSLHRRGFFSCFKSQDSEFPEPKFSNHYEKQLYDDAKNGDELYKRPRRGRPNAEASVNSQLINYWLRSAPEKAWASVAIPTKYAKLANLYEGSWSSEYPINFEDLSENANKVLRQHMLEKDWLKSDESRYSKVSSVRWSGKKHKVNINFRGVTGKWAEEVTAIKASGKHPDYMEPLNSPERLFDGAKAALDRIESVISKIDSASNDPKFQDLYESYFPKADTPEQYKEFKGLIIENIKKLGKITDITIWVEALEPNNIGTKEGMASTTPNDLKDHGLENYASSHALITIIRESKVLTKAFPAEDLTRNFVHELTHYMAATEDDGGYVTSNPDLDVKLKADYWLDKANSNSDLERANAEQRVIKNADSYAWFMQDFIKIFM